MDETYLSFICDKVQKLTEAVYRVSDILSDKEPLKWQMREAAVFIFDNVVSLKGKHFLEKESCFRHIQKDIDKILALFSIFAPSFRIISGINFEILKEQYLSVKDIIAKELEQIKPDSFLAEIKNMTAALGSGQTEEKERTISIGQDDKGQTKGQNIGQKNNVQNVQNHLSDTIPEKEKNIQIFHKPKENNIPSNQRKDKILDILKDKKEAAVSEIAEYLKDCSEKTVQRELIALAQKGILTTRGEKRWRRYRISADSL